MVECTLSITHCLRLNLQLHTIDLVRTCRISSFYTVASQLARFQLTRRIARSLGDSWASCYILISNVHFAFWAFLENRKNSGLTPSQNDDPVTRTLKMTQMTHWPGDPMTQFHIWPVCRQTIWVYEFRLVHPQKIQFSSPSTELWNAPLQQTYYGNSSTTLTLTTRKCR